MFIKIPIVKRKVKDFDKKNRINENKDTDIEETEFYLVNTNNINYIRRWKSEKGYLQTVVYFQNTEKYIIVNMELKHFQKILNLALQ